MGGSLGLALLIASLPASEPQEADAASDKSIYTDSLQSGWKNWSWKSSINFGATPGYNGSSRSISWKVNEAYGGLYLHTDTGIQTNSSTRVKFALRASESDQRYRVAFYDGAGKRLGHKLLSEVGGYPPAGSWKSYDISLSKLGADGKTIKGFQLQDAEGKAQKPLLVDAVTLVNVGSSTSTSPTPTSSTSPTPTPTSSTSAPAAPSDSSSCLSVPAYTEIRPENSTANKTKPSLVAWQWDESKMGNKLKAYYDKITGSCQGTTEQILEWAAKKWGFAEMGYPDLAKAVAVKESTWRQAHKGDYQTTSYYFSPHPTYPSPDYQSYGITQIKRTVWPGSYTNSNQSTAFAADYWGAVVRMAYDGNSWRGSALKGDIWSSVQFWFDSATSSDRSYSNKVREEMEAKRWKQSGF